MLSFAEGLRRLRQHLRNGTGFERLIRAYEVSGLRERSQVQPIESYPRELLPFMDGGLAMQQDPLQLAKFVSHLLINGVRSFVEVGIADGGDFIAIVETIASTGRPIRAWAVDPFQSLAVANWIENHHPGEFWKNKHVELHTVWKPSADFPWSDQPFPEVLDVAILDGDQSEVALRKDVEVYSQAAKTIVIHDVCNSWCPDVVKVWGELKRDLWNKYDVVEFLAQRPSVRRSGKTHFGFGLLVPTRDKVKLAASK